MTHKCCAILDGKEWELEVTPLEAHRFRVTLDGAGHEVDARFCGSETLSLLIDNVSHDISFSREGTAVSLNFRNRHYDIEVLDERHRRMKRVRSGLAHEGGTEMIKTSMPGRVVKVLVEEGAQVEEGAGIIIVEAMKMENEIHCKKAGTVTRVHVAPGDNVEANATLLEIE